MSLCAAKFANQGPDFQAVVCEFGMVRLKIRDLETANGILHGEQERQAERLRSLEFKVEHHDNLQQIMRAKEEITQKMSRLEQLRAKLQATGVLSPDEKQELPELAKRV